MRHQRLGARYEIVLTILAILSATASFFVLSTDQSPFDLTGGATVTILFTLNLVLVLLLGVSVGRWFIKIRSARRSGGAAARLHLRVTGVFMAIAVVPPIVMAIFSALMLEQGLQTWFGERVRDTVDNSLKVAQSYIAENRQIIEADATFLAGIFSRNADATLADKRAAAQEAVFQRQLSELLLIELHAGEEPLVIVRASQGLSLGSGTTVLPRSVLQSVEETGSYLATNSGDATFIAMRKLTGFLHPTFLYLARDLNPLILQQYEKTLDAVETFNQLESQQGDFQRQFSILYIFLAILILLAAIWTGLWFSSRLVDPLSELMAAAQRFGEGDLSMRVPYNTSSDELGSLSRAFNRMADQLEASQAELVRANLALDERRRFVEEVLENVSAGVIGLNANGTVFLPNRSACQYLAMEPEELIGRPMVEAVPEFADLLEASITRSKGVAEEQIEVSVAGDTRVLLVRVAAERAEGESRLDGFVVTFDDITDQIANQRTAAWADVARRIAHEIKNPLTPIQLSAERLKRRYRTQIESSDTVFDQCTDTIVRQVGDLRRMVDEFSSFARMPAPLFKETDMVDLIRQSVFLQEVANNDINFDFVSDCSSLTVPADGRLLGQALTNILKNASESVNERLTRTDVPGRIKVSLKREADEITVTVDDNGIGLPEGQKDKLMDPYVTTRTKGTGLGLAIVKRIVEEHGGRIRLSNLETGGASVCITLSEQALDEKYQRALSPSATAAE